ncbi:MAG: UDP-2,3-diacylglucosamine hydrolase [Thiomicrorhabdus sp.]|nr:MAG: UDP-2,3-diacylglucosamine hydrolase [Thiomicrorhabdus sp.]
MMPYSLIVADVHLQPEQDHPINQAFKQFMTEDAPKAESLYILGDLFEMWAGDDIGLIQYAPIIKLFKTLTDQGTPIYLQYGNRDFLMGKAFWKATGITRLKDVHKVTLYGKDYLMLHGDSLCTDDKGYQRMRSVFRNPVVKWIFLHLCKKRRLFIGQKMRQNSKSHSQNKPDYIMDINQQAMCELFKKHQSVRHMIHGHTHRPAHHTIEAQHTTLNRWVLGDWQAQGSPTSQIIKVSQIGPELLDYH